MNLFELEIYKELDLEDHCEFVMGRGMLFLVCIYDNKHATPFARRRCIINIRIKLLLPCVQDKDQDSEMDSITLSQGSVRLENRQHGRGSSWVCLCRGGTFPLGPKKMPSCSACSYDFSSEPFCTIVSRVYTAKWYYRTHRQKYLYIAQNTHQQFGPLHTKRQLPWPIWINYGKA